MAYVTFPDIRRLVMTNPGPVDPFYDDDPEVDDDSEGQGDDDEFGSGNEYGDDVNGES